MLEQLLFRGWMLSGKRRQTYMRCAAIDGLIFVVCAIILLVTVLVASAKGEMLPSTMLYIMAAAFAIIITALQLFRFIRGETIWQLRIDEYREQRAALDAKKKEMLGIK